jgi:hypothetical protein
MVLARQESCARLSRGSRATGRARHAPPARPGCSAFSPTTPHRSTDPTRTTLGVIGGVQILSDESCWTSARREEAQLRFAKPIVDAFYDEFSAIAADPWDVRGAHIPL